MTNLITVKGRYRQFLDANSRVVELDNNVSVEMKVVAVPLKRNPPKRAGRVKAIATVELTELRMQHPILKSGQHLITDPLILRHATFQCVAFVDHPRAEYDVRILGDEWCDEVGQFLGRILTNAMQ